MMATNMDKAFYQAPQGLDQIDEGDEPALEITIEDPEAVEIGIDGMPIMRIEEGEEEDDDFNANLAEEMDAAALATLAGDLIGDFENDVSSRKDWVQTYVDGLRTLRHEAGGAHGAVARRLRCLPPAAH
jgi:hypothetical protein